MLVALLGDEATLEATLTRGLPGRDDATLGVAWMLEEGATLGLAMLEALLGAEPALELAFWLEVGSTLEANLAA